MSDINWNEILGEIKACLKTKEVSKEIDDLLDDYFIGGTSDSPFTEEGGMSLHTPEDAAAKLIEVLQKEIESHAAGGSFSTGKLGDTAIAALSNLGQTKAFKIGPRKYTISVYFKGDMERDSLYKSKYPEGVSDIALLLNNGYSAGNAVYGVWQGHKDGRMTMSLTERVGAHFIDNAIRDFMGNYAVEYGVERIEIEEDDS